MEAWAELFERAAASDATVEEVEAALADRRRDGAADSDDADGGNDASDANGDGEP